MKCAALVLMGLLGVALSQTIQLEQYNINPDTITVSGLSAGGAYATQFHVIYSGELKGAAIFAGLVYHCANGILGTALMCMSSPYLTNVNSLIRKTDDLADEGKIDATTGMAGDKVYILAGTKDTTVRPANGPLIEEFYENYGSDIFTNFEIVAEHCQPTDNYGPACTYNGGEFINDCDYNGAYEALNFLYDETLVRPADTLSLTGLYSEFDQAEFFGGNPSAESVDDVGYIYVPSGCVDKTETCHLHVVFHGCKQGREFLDDVFVTKTQYLETAEANNIIMIFPQIAKTSLSNPNGCFDWWGYTGIYKYVNNEGPQNIGIRAMIQRLVNGA